jgi:RNA polymerase sigma factor (sigma-70 family)
VRLAAREGEGRRGLIALATPRSRGGRAALTQVYQQHHQELYRYCRALLRDDHDAQDALQSTMTRAFAALRDERRDFELRPWLFRIAHNEAISMLRRRRPVEELDDRPATAATVEDQVALNVDVETLRGDIEALPERQRAALLLRELNGLSHEEIGQALDCRAEQVKQTIYQARTTLLQAREGREMECGEVRRAVSDGDGRVLRSTRIQAHLRSCAGCRSFHDDLDRRPAKLALLAPPLPVAAGAALLERLLPGAAAPTAGLMAALAPKAVTMVAVVAATATGATTVAHHRDRPPPHPVAAHGAPAATPLRAAAPVAFTGVVSPGGGSRATPVAGADRAAGANAAAKRRGGATAKRRSHRGPAKTRSRSDQAKPGSQSAAAATRSRSAEATTRSRSTEAKTRSQRAVAQPGAAAPTRSRSAEAKARSRRAEAKTRSRAPSAEPLGAGAHGSPPPAPPGQSTTPRGAAKGR